MVISKEMVISESKTTANTVCHNLGMDSTREKN
jgi:hypothetical protein